MVEIPECAHFASASKDTRSTNHNLAILHRKCRAGKVTRVTATLREGGLAEGWLPPTLRRFKHNAVFSHTIEGLALSGQEGEDPSGGYDDRVEIELRNDP